jgi:hypothetical protein
MMPIMVNGIASMITSGNIREPVWNISSTKISSNAAPKAIPNRGTRPA